MNCNEARRMITPYVKKELSEKEMEQFLHHVEHCSDCMDELDTYYMVYQALDLLDSDSHHNYDLKKMLREDLRSAQRRLVRKRVLGIFTALMLFLTELLLGMSVYTGYEVEKMQTEHTLIQRAILRLNNADKAGVPEQNLSGASHTKQELKLENEKEKGADYAG